MANILLQSDGWRGVSVGLATAAAATAAIAAEHVFETAQRGVICGMANSQLGHCWACYAAPLLALAAVAAWRAGVRSRLIPVRAK